MFGFKIVKQAKIFDLEVKNSQLEQKCSELENVLKVCYVRGEKGRFQRYQN